MKVLLATPPRPPGPKGNFLLGNSLQVKRDPLAFLTRCAREHGEIVRLRFAHQVAYLINKPDFIESVLVSNSQNFVKTAGRKPSRLSRLLHSNELLSRVVNFPSDGEFWTRERRWVQPSFHRERLVSYSDEMIARTRRMLGAWRDGETRNIHQEMMMLSLGVVAKTLFGAEVDGQAREVVTSFEVIMHEIASRMGNPLQLPVFAPTRRNARLRAAVRRLDAFMDSVIGQQRDDGQLSDSLLSTLLNARDERGGIMTNGYWRYQIMTLFIAGYETTALALTWTWYLLSQNPEAWNKLSAELLSVLAGRVPTAADVPQLRYTEMVVKEAMRLYPPVWLFGARMALGDYELGGQRMPAGSMVIISPWVTQRDPHYFPDAEAFNPDRWSPSAAQHPPKYAYFPFSAGSRHCIGSSYAMMEMILIVATIAQSFRLSLVAGHPIELQPLITLRPKYGLPMVLTKLN